MRIGSGRGSLPGERPPSHGNFGRGAVPSLTQCGYQCESYRSAAARGVIDAFAATAGVVCELALARGNGLDGFAAGPSI